MALREEEIAKLLVTIEANVGALKTGMTTANKQVKTFSKDMKKSFASVKKNWIAVTAVITGSLFALKRAFSTYTDFAQRMTEVNTLLRLTTESFADLTQQVLDLTRVLPQTASELAAAEYDIVSAGVTDLAESMEALELSAKAAVAGVTSTKIAANAGLAVMNAYGKTVADLPDIFDTLFKTVELGVVRFEELSQNLGQVLPIARAAGVDFETISAALASLTKVGIKAPEAVTALRGALVALNAPTKAAKEEMKNLGITSGDLVSMLEQIAEQNLGLDQMRKIVPDVRAGKGILALAQNMQVLDDTMAKIGDRTGSMEAAFDMNLESPGNQIKLFTNTIDRLAIKASEFASVSFLPALKGIADALDEMVDSGAAEKLGKILGTLLSMIIEVFDAVISNWKVYLGLAVALNVGELIALIQSLTATVILLNTALLTNPFVIAVAGVVALGVAVFAVTKRMTDLNEQYETFGNASKRFKITAVVGDIQRQAQLLEGMYEWLIKNNEVFAKTGKIPENMAKGFAEAEEKLASLDIVLEKDLQKRLEQIERLADPTAKFWVDYIRNAEKADKLLKKDKKDPPPGVPDEEVLAQAAATFAAYSDEIKLNLIILARQFKDNEIAITDYYEARREIAETVVNAEIELLRERLALEDDEAGRIGLRAQISAKEAELMRVRIQLRGEEADAIKANAKAEREAATIIEEVQKRAGTLSSAPGDLGSRFAQEQKALQDTQLAELEAFKELKQKEQDIEDLYRAQDLEKEALHQKQKAELREWHLDQIASLAAQNAAIFEDVYQQLLAAERNKAEASQAIAEAEGEAKKDITDKQLMEQKKSLRVAFLLSKAAALAQVGIDTAVGVMKAYSQLGAYASAAAILIAAQGGLATGKIIGQTIAGFADGGAIKDGTGKKSDDVLIRASKGEFMQPAAAVDYYGASAMEAIRRRTIPKSALSGFGSLSPRTPIGRFADGGAVTNRVDNTGGGQRDAFQIVNVVDSKMLDRYLASGTGKRVILNVLAENEYEIKRILA